jgi:hypothetical protein
MSLTATYNTPCGVINISINTSTDEVMEVMSVGNIKYEYDIGTGQANLDRLFAIYNTVDIEIQGYSQKGTALFDYLIGQTATAKIVDMTLTTYESVLYRFRFTLSQDSIKYKSSTKIITLLCNPIQPTQTVETVFQASPNDAFFPVSFVSGNSINASGIGALNFVKQTLDLINPNLSSVYSSYPIQGTDLSPDSYMYLDNTTNLPTIGLTYGIVYKQIGGDTLSGIAIETLKSMAAVEGGIVGTGFDKNFYIQRLSTQYLATLTQNDVEELSFEYGYKPYASIAVTILTDSKSNLDQVTILEQYNNEALKKMDVNFPVPYLYKAEWETGVVGDTFITNIVTTADYEAGLAFNAVDSYVASFGAKNRLVVDVNVLGFDKIKPYDMVTFSSGSELPSTVTGKYFRPTSLEYDLFNNKLKAKLYYVGDV